MGQGQSRPARREFSQLGQENSEHIEYDDVVVRETTWSIFQWVITIGNLCVTICALFVLIIFFGWVVVNSSRRVV
jgi:hypothetical protein